MGIAANPARRHVSRTTIPGHRAWWRLGRLTALTVAYVMVLTLLHMTIPRFSDWWIGHNLFALCYPYLLLAVWLGDVWEALSAVTISAAVTAWMTLSVLRSFQYGPSRFWVQVPVDGGSWLLYVASALAIVGLVHRRRSVTPRIETAAPVVSAAMDSPVLVIHGHVQVLQGGGVVFDSGTQQGATEQLVPGEGQQTLH